MSDSFERSIEQSNLKELHEHILRSVSEGIHVVDANGIVLVENEASAAMLGWSGDGLVGRHGHQAIHHHHADLSEFPLKDCPIYATIQDGQTRHVEEDVFWRKDGTSFPVEYTAAPLLDREGKVYGATCVFRDITERKEAQARILRMAQYCSLTDLPNRALFSDRLKQTLATSKRNQAKSAVMFIDLDKFKPVNDTFGHGVGDVLLQKAAHRMSQSVRQSDTVARIGGDEFVVLLPVIDSANDALLVAEKIRQQLNEPFAIDGHAINISSSIGIAIYPDHGLDELELSKSADMAMYKVKESGRNRVMISGS